MIDDTRVYEILSEICEDVTPKRSKRGFVSRCPVCGDSQKSKKIRRLHTDFYSRYDDWTITCYNGGCPFHSGNVYSLYATVKGVTFSEAKKYINDDVYDSEVITKTLSASNKTKKVVTEIPDHELDLEKEDIIYLGDNPTGTVEKRYHGMLLDFVLDRKIPAEYVDGLCVAHQGRYQGRVIVPIYLNNKLMYFQGRSLFDNITPKYLNPDIDKEMIISNSDKFSRDKFIIVTEGLIDSWMVEDHQGTSVNGGYLNDELVEHLLTLTDKGVIFVPDNPKIDKAGRETLIKFMEESKYAGKVKYFILDGDFKDLNEVKINRPKFQFYQYIVEHSKDRWGAETQLSLSSW